MNGVLGFARHASWCRSRYIALSRETRRNGLDAGGIAQSCTLAARAPDGRLYLSEKAYQPTGLALGCPLPSRAATSLLWRLSDLAARRLTHARPSSGDVFAYVPPASYHITIVNRSHFDKSQELLSITPAEYVAIGSAVQSLGQSSIIVFISGLVLTAQGRLIACGYPVHDGIDQLRSCLRGQLPQLRINTPQTAHIKLGHVLIGMDRPQLNAYTDWLSLLGLRAVAMLEFVDAYTPVNRMPLHERYGK